MSKQYLLRWHLHQTTILENLSKFLDDNTMTDCTLTVGTTQLHAHRIVLAMCSLYFLQLFQEMGNLIQHPIIVMHNTDINDLKAILSFIYKGQCMVTKGQIPNLIALAKLLKIQGLKDMNIPLDDDVSNNLETIEKKSGETSCKCFICGKYLSNQYNLRIHMETHEETYHACTTCTHVSRSRDALRKHVSYRHPEQYGLRKRKKTTTVGNTD